jgi:hypothetical protein
MTSPPFRIAFALALAALGLTRTALAQSAEETSPRLVVKADPDDELASAYGAPPDLSHGRISTLTKSYVLSPFTVEVENIYTGSFFRHAAPAHLFTQEVEIGLPARFTVGLQNQFGRSKANTAERSFTLEGRYALADWNKLPLNPAISAEYWFGLGNQVADSGEIALLVSRDFPHMIEWALNVFVDREFGKRSSTSAGFAQSAEVPILLPEEKVEIGIEMQYRSGGEQFGSLRSGKGVQVGPTIAWRPTKKLRFDLSPLFGCSNHAPAVQVFGVFSLSFGGNEAGDTESPVSAHAR